MLSKAGQKLTVNCETVKLPPLQEVLEDIAYCNTGETIKKQLIEISLLIEGIKEEGFAGGGQKPPSAVCVFKNTVDILPSATRNGRRR